MIGPVEWTRSGDANIAYRVVGDGPVDLVFLGGLMSHVEVMLEEPGVRRWFERLGQIARTVLVDRRGAGLSDPLPDVWTTEQEVEDLLQVLDAVGLERVVVCSVGAATLSAIELAIARPDRVLALILYAPSFRATPADKASWNDFDDRRAEWVTSTIKNWGTGKSLGILAPSAANSPRLQAWLGRMERLSATPTGVARLIDKLSGMDVGTALTQIQAPTLIAYREDDPFVEESQVEFGAAQISGAKVVRLPGADALPMIGDTEPLLSEIEEFLTGKRSGAESERALLTIVITDVVEATPRLVRLGDARWRDLLAAHDEAIRDQVDRFGGRVINTAGDSFVVGFDGLPSLAAHAAAEFVAATKRLNVDIRVGMHTGECELIGDDIGGLAVHIASRICDVAGVGEVLVSPSTYATTIGSGLTFEDRGQHELKGVPFAWPLFALRHS